MLQDDLGKRHGEFDLAPEPRCREQLGASDATLLEAITEAATIVTTSSSAPAVAASIVVPRDADSTTLNPAPRLQPIAPANLAAGFASWPRFAH